MDHSLRPGLLLSATDADCGCDDPNCDAGKLATQIDERTVAYVLAVRPYFEDLRQAISQIAGMLVLAASGAKSVTQDHAMFSAAREAHRRALDGVRSTRPTTRALHHHKHLLGAVCDLGMALARSAEHLHAASVDKQRSEMVFDPLKSAFHNLNWAARSLPGCEILSFDQACCAPQQATLQE
jgi:hypothetical protein